MTTGPQDETRASGLLDEVGPAFSRLRRGAALNAEKPIARKDLSRSLVLGVTEEVSAREGDETTVGTIAERLGIDPSAASRLVSDCISEGYLLRTASQVDGRRTILQLTPAGREMLTSFRRHQRSAYEHITRDWSDHDRLEFARLLIKYVDSLARLQARTDGN